MITVYLDKQILSYTRKALAGEEQPVELSTMALSLYNFIKDHRESFLLFYSHAHLLDLGNDPTDKKFEDLAFMDTLIGRYYLVWYFQATKTTCLLKAPSETFDPEEVSTIRDSIESFKDVFDFSKYRDFIPKDQIADLEGKLEQLNTPMPGLPLPLDSSGLGEDYMSMLGRMIPLEGNVSFIEWMDSFLNLSKDIQDDKKTYIGLRDMVARGTEMTRTNSHLPDLNKHIPDIILPVDLKDEDFDRKLEQNVRTLLGKIGTPEPTLFELHYHAYYMLDMHGVIKERNKKIKPKSMMNDAHHSFYGAHCDYLISNDTMFREKASIVNRVYGVRTRVVSPEEFLEEWGWLGSRKADYNFDDFWGDLRRIVNSEGQIFCDKETGKGWKTWYVEKRLFDYFNVAFSLAEENPTLLLEYRSGNYQGGTPRDTIKAVTNKVVGALGPDYDGKGDFSEQLPEDPTTWEGRRWLFTGGWLITLGLTSESLQLTIIFLEETDT